MDTKGFLKSPIHRTFMPEIFALAISAGVLFQVGSPLDDTFNCYLQSFLAMLTLFLAMALLPLHLVMNSSNPLNTTYQFWIHNLSSATLVASFVTLVLSVANSTSFSPQCVSWASECGLIILAIGVAYKLISEITTSWFQQYIKVAFFTLCVAIAGVYTEPLGSMTPTISYNSVIYQAYRIHHFGLVPCTFVLGMVLLILGVAVPSSSAVHFISAMLKEDFAKLTLSVGYIAFLIGIFLTVCASGLFSALVGGVEAGGVGAI